MLKKRTIYKGSTSTTIRQSRINRLTKEQAIGLINNAVDYLKLIITFSLFLARSLIRSNFLELECLQLILFIKFHKLILRSLKILK